MKRARGTDGAGVPRKRGGGRSCAAALAEAAGLEVSGHCAPHVHAHAAAAVPNLRHLEWFHDHVRVERLLFDGVLAPAGGTISPGAGGAPLVGQLHTST